MGKDELKLRPVEILLIEDNPGDVLLVREMLKDACDIRFDMAACIATAAKLL